MRLRPRLLWLIASIALAYPAAAQTLNYDVVFDGKTMGRQIVTSDSEGKRTVEFSYRDNGRGPDLREEYVEADDGTLRSFQVRGKSTFGAPVDEWFRIENGKAVWKAAADAGERPLGPQPAFYVPVESSPESLAVLVRALAQAPERRLDALPGGELTLRKVEDAQITRDGQARQVGLYAVSGLSLTPALVWMTDERPMQLFASIAPGYARIAPQGWDAQAAELEQRQVAAESTMLRELATRLTHAPAQPLVVRNARVFDSERAVLGAPADVYVDGGRIVAIEPAGRNLRPAVTAFDAGGRTLLPGLFDMHDHGYNWNSPLHLAGGVTSVRDMGNDNATLARLIADIDAGRLMGPRVVRAGFLEGESAYSARNGFVVKDLDGARKAIDFYAREGFVQLKIYNSFPKEILTETVAYAHRKGLRVSGHVPAFMTAEDVVRAGFDEIQHINQVMLGFFVKPGDDTRTLARFYLISDNAYALDLESKRVRDFIALLKRRKVDVDATLAVFEDMKQRSGEPLGTFAPIIDHLPVSTQRAARTTSFDVPEDKIERYIQSYDKMVQMVGHLYRAGVPLVAGTDGVPGFTLHRELELYVKAGVPPAQALKIATWNGARYSRVLDQRGSIAVGKQADLILVDGNPTRDIGALRKVALTMKGGVAFYPDEIYPALGVKPFTASVKAVAIDEAAD